MVIMAFDEQGQADTYQRKIDICKRSFDILTEQANINPRDIIFDPNIFAIVPVLKSTTTMRSTLFRPSSGYINIPLGWAVALRAAYTTFLSRLGAIILSERPYTR